MDIQIFYKSCISKNIRQNVKYHCFLASCIARTLEIRKHCALKMIHIMGVMNMKLSPRPIDLLILDKSDVSIGYILE